METRPNTKRGCFLWLRNDGGAQSGFVKVQRVHIMRSGISSKILSQKVTRSNFTVKFTVTFLLETQ